MGMDISKPFGVPGELCFLLTQSHLWGNVRICLLILTLQCYVSCKNNFLPLLKNELWLHRASIPASLLHPPTPRCWHGSLSRHPHFSYFGLRPCYIITQTARCYFLFGENSIRLHFNSDGAKKVWVSIKKEKCDREFLEKVAKQKKGGGDGGTFFYLKMGQ